MAARMDALGQLTEQSKAMNMANLFIILLFVAVETAPIFVKLLADKGPYDYFLEKHEEELLLYNQELLTKSRESSKGRLQHFLAIREQDTSLSIDKDLYLNQLKAEQQKRVEAAKIDFQSKE